MGHLWLMNRRASLLLALLLALGLVLPGALGAAEGGGKPVTPTHLQPGRELAQAISIITGVAVSPLLGVGAVFAKDAFGAALPTPLKKPFDLVELFENKLSALVAAGAFVPLMLSVFPAAPGLQSAWYGTPRFASISWGAWGNALMAPAAIMLFLMVWLTAHTVQVLIVISPFSTLDLALKAARFGLLCSIALTAWVHPFLGAAWALIIIVMCYFTAGWSFRLMVMGTVFAWDLLTMRSRRFRPSQMGAAFTARTMEKVPIRSYGVLARDDQGRLVFRYRPWLVMPVRHLILPAGPHVVGRGLFHPELLHRAQAARSPLLRFPPRYLGHEETLATVYGLAGVEDIGLRAAWRWLKEWLGLRPDLGAALRAEPGAYL